MSGQPTEREPTVDELVQLIRHAHESLPAADVPISCRFKGMLVDDTATVTGRVMFWKDEVDPDSIGKFILWRNEQLICAYDGSTLYLIDGIKRTIETVSSDQQPFLQFIQGNQQRSHLADRMLVSKKRLLQTYRQLDSARVETISGPYRRLIFSDTMAYTKYQPSDWGYVSVRRAYETEPSVGSIRKISEWVQMSASAIQYREVNYGAVRRLAAHETFTRAFNIDSLSRLYAVSQIHIKNSDEMPSLLGPGSLLPEFTLNDLDGNPVSTASLAGERLVLLDFWYKTCMPCLRAMPVVEKLHQTYGPDGLRVFGVNVYDRDAAQLKQFLQKRSVSYPSLLDLGGKLGAAIHATGYPVILLFDPATRKIHWSAAGYSEALEQELEARVKQLLRR